MNFLKRLFGRSAPVRRAAVKFGYGFAIKAIQIDPWGEEYVEVCGTSIYKTETDRRWKEIFPDDAPTIVAQRDETGTGSAERSEVERDGCSAAGAPKS